MSYRKLMIIIPILLTLVSNGAASGQVTTEWAKRYDGPIHMSGKPSAIAVDSSGNVIVTGSSKGLNGKLYYATIKYDSGGKRLWIKNSQAPGSAKALALDDSGNIYVTGMSSKDYLTIKYDSLGNEVWNRQYEGGAGYVDSASVIAVGDDGSVFVSGNSIPPQGYSDYLTIKYNSAGDILWTNRYDGTGSKKDEVKAIAVDNLGNVCVTGSSMGSSGNYDLTTVKYDVNGEEFWVKRYAGIPDRVDQGKAIAVDSDRNVYVAGTSGVHSADFLVIKYDSYGAELWVQRYDGPSHGDDSATGIAVDSLGSVYVAGFSHDPIKGDDLTLVRYNGEGEFCWASRYNGTANGEDRACAVAVDAFGKIYVTGSSIAVDSALNQVTLKFDTNGQKLWAKIFNGGSLSEDRPVGVALDHSSNVYVTGASQPPDGTANYVTIKYAQPPLWEKSTINSPYARTPEIAVDSSGRPHMCYLDYPEDGMPLLRYAVFDGATWKKTILQSGYAGDYSMAIDSFDHIHISYSTDDNLKYAYFDGTSWNSWIVDGRGASTSITVDAQNRPHISYIFTGGSGYVYSLRYAHHDGTQWIKETINGVGGPLYFGGTSLALDPSGKAHITVSDGNLPRQLHYATNTTGSWKVTKIADGRQASLALDDSGHPHIVYCNESNQRIDYAKHNGSKWVTMSLQHALGIDGYADDPRIKIDATGLIHATFSLRSMNLRQLIHAYKGTRNWAYDRIDSNTDYAPIAIATHGRDIHLGYRAEGTTGTEMNYARSIK